MDRRGFLGALAGAGAGLVARGQSSERRPNVVLIMADDLGYGDLGCYGSGIRTPNLDRMAAEGVRFTQFYSASPLCTPSRASLLTGRYATRMGLPTVLFPDSEGGIPASETTIAQSLGRAGYATRCIGKWHLGGRPDYLPTSKGFESYYGIPHSNDMWPLPMMRGTQVVEEHAANAHLTQQFTAEAVSTIRAAGERPYFMFLSHPVPHIPIGVSERFKGRSGLGMYGDAVAELDWGVGEVLKAVEESGQAENTLVMFTSDNGPWYQGSPGRLRGRKGETYEGGMRVPFIARMKGRIEAGTESAAAASLLDIFPTLARMGGAVMPPVELDGEDLGPVLRGEVKDVERSRPMLYFDHWDLQCARLGPWKAHFARFNSPPWIEGPAEGRMNLPLARPELYNVERDPQESYECGEQEPEVLEELTAMVERAVEGFPPDVQSAWHDTKRRRTQWVPTGARPAPQRP